MKKSENIEKLTVSQTMEKIEEIFQKKDFIGE